MLAPGLHAVPPGKLAAVVTHLRHAGPAPARIPAPNGLTLGPGDGMSAHEYRTLFRLVGRDWLWSGRLVLDDAALAQVLGRPGRRMLVARRDDDACGFAEITVAGGIARLDYFGMAPDLTGQGAGRWLMREALAVAFGAATEVKVHTCTLDHPRALAFYIAAGFVPERREVEILDDPRAVGVLDADAAPRVPLL